MALNRAQGSNLPPLVLMTDDERLSDPVAAASALPPGSIVVVRARQSSHRAKLAQALRPIARRRALTLMIANDPALVDRVRAAGLHLAEANVRWAADWRARRPHWLITVSAHSLASCARISRLGANAAFLSPVLPTASHPQEQSIGPARAGRIVRQAPLPVYALGGIAASTARRLAGSGFAGLAAVGALAA